MDNQQVADQLKLAVKWSVRNRFWIALGFSALLPMIGYMIGSAPIKNETQNEVKKIKGADSGVRPYTQPGIANPQWKPLIDEKKDILANDVNKAWDKLYARQAPLLTWPALVADKFRVWGRKWPETVDLSVVQRAITDYVGEYEKAVDDTYKKVNPWDPIAGTGIVEVPDKATLLQPAVFDVAKPPDLGKVWAAQEKLWIQGTLLDAISKINGSAKSWDDAVVKRLESMDVGTPTAQDQKSLVKGQTVKLSPEILAPGQTSTAAAPTSSAPAGQGGGGMPPGMGGSAGFGASATAAQDLYYIEAPSQAYSLLPIKLTALVDQNRLQDFFIGLENSPMAIQVMEFELLKPINPVLKPVKLEGTPGFGGMAGGMGKGGGGDAMRRASGGGMMAPGGRGNMSGMMAGGGGGGGGTANKGKDVRDKDPKKIREEKEKMLKSLGRAIDTYYDVVEVTVYGQARFYNPPPTPPAEPVSAATPPAEDATKAAAKPGAEPAKTEDATKAEAKPEAKPGTEPAKADAEAKPGDASKPVEAPKKDETKPADTTKPAETTKPGDQPKR
jgi:hypothetical protein